MLCLLSSHGMLGFIDGTFPSPDHHDDQIDYNGKGKPLLVARDIKKKKKKAAAAWMRSDSLVKGWILGSLSEEAAVKVVNRMKSDHFTAKDAWDQLQTIYGPSLLLPQKPVEVATNREVEEEKRRKRQSLSQTFYRRILNGAPDHVRYFLEKEGLVPTDKITNNGNTTLHVAVGSSTGKNPEILEELLGMIPRENTLLDLVNSDGSTLLHVAAIVGNTQAANILLKRNLDLLMAEDNEGHTPLAVSLSNMHTETSKCLLNHIDTEIHKDPMLELTKDTKYHRTLFSGTSGDELLVLAISSKNFRLASDLLRHYKTIHSEAVLMAVAQNFPCELKFWERIGVWPFIGDRVRAHYFASSLLWTICQKIKDTTDSNHCYTNPVFEATRLNAFEVVKTIVSEFPNTIWSTNEDGHHFIQYAVINRSEKIYNMLYQMSEHKNIYKTIKDSFGNNLLHLAARLAPSNKLNLISGAALQLQRELQWFKEVEGFVRPLNKIQKNSCDETPELVFTSQHKNLVIEGEKWMKATAKSYTITAALIITVVFAAAITVPGGNDDKTGKPRFCPGKDDNDDGCNYIVVASNDTTWKPPRFCPGNDDNDASFHANITYTHISIYTSNNKTREPHISCKPAFKVFATSNAISLFTAVTSLLMFLSILTTRFAERDFLFKLPRRLIIGLAALFISTTAMIIAFGASLYLLFEEDQYSWLLYPIGALTCLPITSFVTLQFPLVADLISSTYGRRIFVKKKSHDYFY
uniref:uncharacterized protein LOC122609531 n=1 Tax=Erigeron canadensis TaxID=72917 RepID=UPI001CB96FB1|nr:uncharacterized protein LOC122609531 [Erigeron canadensis]